MLKNPYKLYKDSVSLFINVDDIVFFGNTSQFKEAGDIKFSLLFSLLHLKLKDDDNSGTEINKNNAICLNRDYIYEFQMNEIGEGNQKPLVFVLYIYINKVKYLFGHFTFDFNMEKEEFLELKLDRKYDEDNDEIEFINSVINKPFSCSLFIRTYPENKSKFLTSSNFSNEIYVFDDILVNGNNPTNEGYSVRHFCEALTGENVLALGNNGHIPYLAFPTMFTFGNLIEIVNKKVFNNTNRANIENVYNYMYSHTLNNYLSNLRKHNNERNSFELNGTDKTKLVYAICSALVLFNNSNFHHSEVTPLNIFIDNENKECKLADFVISKKYDIAKQFTETLFYKPCTKSNSEIKYQQDIYSVGVIIYELLTNGDNPKRNDPSAHFEFDLKIIKNNVNIPENIKTLLISMLNENECLRPTAREIMIMIEGKQFSFPETNFEEVSNYIQRIKAVINKEVLIMIVRFSMPILAPKNYIKNKTSENTSDSFKSIFKFLYFQMGVNCYYEGDIEAATDFFKLGSNENCVFSKFMFDFIKESYPENLVSKTTSNYDNTNINNIILSFKEKYESLIIKNEEDFDFDYRKIVIKGILDNPKDIKDMYVVNTSPFIYKGEQKNARISAIINYHTKRANSGDAKSQFYLGCFYLSFGDPQKSQYYYELATNQNHKFSPIELGHFYEGDKKKMHCLKDPSKALALYLKSAELGNNGAYGDIGCFYERLNDNRNAEKYYQLAAKCGIASSLLNLGYFYQDGVVVKKDIKKSIELYQLSACMQFFDGFYNLGAMYMTGNGVKVDMDKAMYYLLLACKENVADAFFNMGSIYKKSELDTFSGESQEMPKLVKTRYFYQLAADHNQAIGQYSIAVIYRNEGEFEKSMYYFEKSVGNGYSESALPLIKLYEALANTTVNHILQNESLSQNQKDEEITKQIGAIYQKMHVLLEESASQGNFQSMFILGRSYREGLNGYPRDFEKAKYILEVAANQGNVVGAFFQLGRMYQEGQGVKKDERKAFEYINIASMNGYARATCNLACMYLQGDCCVAKDDLKAFTLMKKAAEMGSNDALMNLAMIYEDGLPGISLEANPKEAHRCRRRALKNGSLNIGLESIAQDYLTGFGCKENIDKALKYMNIERGLHPKNKENLYNLGVIFQDPNYNRVDVVKSIEMFEKAAELGHPIACHNLGLIYIQGKHVQKNIKKSFDYFKMAVEKGYLSSYSNLAEFFLNGYDASIGFPKDINRALQYLCFIADDVEYRNSGNGHHYDVCLKVAKIYYGKYFYDENEGIEYIDFKKAAHYMRIAADEANDREACYWMAQILFAGEGVEANREAGNIYLKKAMEQGFMGFLTRNTPIIIKSDEPIEVIIHE